MDWENIGGGFQVRYHTSRKFGRRFDRYIRGRYQLEGKRQIVAFGWESEWVAAERARMLAEGDTGPRMSFLEYCQGELARLKQNALKGVGPVTLKEDRELALAKAKEEEEARAAEEKAGVTFGAYFEEKYLPVARTHKKTKTMQEEESIFKVWLKPNIGKTRLVDLRPLHIEKVKKAMLDDGRAPRRVQYALAVIRQAWNHARNAGVVAGDWPGRGVRLPRIDNRRMRFLSPQDADKLLTEIKTRSEQTHNISLVSLDCGLRFGEVVSLQWGNIDIDQGLIMVVDTKSGKNRAAFMTARVKDMFRGLPQGKKTDLVFCDRGGEPITKVSHSFFRSVDKLKLNEGIEDRRDKVVFHTLRHSYASNLVSSGSGLYVVSQLLGHADVTMAARYSHLENGSLRKAVADMEQATTKLQAEQESQAKVVPIKKSGNT